MDHFHLEVELYICIVVCNTSQTCYNRLYTLHTHSYLRVHCIHILSFREFAYRRDMHVTRTCTKYILYICMYTRRTHIYIYYTHIPTNIHTMHTPIHCIRPYTCTNITRTCSTPSVYTVSHKMFRTQFGIVGVHVWDSYVEVTLVYTFTAEQSDEGVKHLDETSLLP